MTGAPALDAGRRVCGDGDADARHRGGQHRAVGDRRRPRHRPLRPAVGRRRLHARPGRRRDHRRLARRPLRSPAAVRDRSRHLHRHVAPVRGGDSRSMLNSARAAQGMGAAIMFAVSLAVLSHAFPSRRSAARRSPPTGRRWAPRSRSARWWAARSPAASTGVGSSSSTCRSGCSCLWIMRRYVAESLDPGRPRVDLPGLVTLTGRPVPARVRAAARQRGRLVERHDHRLASPAPPRCWRLRRHRGARRGADAPARAVPQPVVHRRAGRGLRDLGVVLRRCGST